MSFLSDLAQAHQRHEGWFPGSLSYRNNNPGNLRGQDGQFRVFPTYAAGFAALQADLKAKISGTAGSVQAFIRGTGRTYEQLVFQDYVSIYAPSADRNNPIRYCDALCTELSRYHLTPSTPLSIMAQLVRGEIVRVPDPPSPVLSNEQRLRSAGNALRWATDIRRNALLRLIDRLRATLATP